MYIYKKENNAVYCTFKCYTDGTSSFAESTVECTTS